MEVLTNYKIELCDLDLGNNFTTEHLITAIAESKDGQELFEFLGECDCDADVTLTAQVKFNYNIEETFVAHELFDLIEAEIESDDFLEYKPNVCAGPGCSTEIEDNQHCCSEQCRRNWIND